MVKRRLNPSTDRAIPNSWGSLAIDYMDMDGGSNYSVMLVYEKAYKRFLLQGGLGSLGGFWYGWNNARGVLEYIDASGMGLRLGIGYEYKVGNNFTIKPAYEHNFSFDKQKLAFGGINLNFGWQQ